MPDDVRPSRFAWLQDIWNGWTSEQQLGVGVFGICGALTLVFSSWYLHAQIQAPFLASRTQLVASRELVNELSKNQQTQDALRLKDTDGDGLNDWDELNTYRTSPYLADSDSDGLQDGLELSRGTDPNCPQGRECQPRLDGLTQRSTTSSGAGLLQGTAAAGAAAAGGQATTPPAQLTAPEIRALLLSNRLVTEEELKGLSDQAVLELYRRGTSSPSPSPAPATNPVPSR
ncbi:hypothetical protein KBD61_01020 [Patescibacteria group bacterium]|nr:hypothetical protein [Patescibacteria group bacterium]MBP9709590.1 hypothetical protein [Patescibacteria group bacterium]